MTDFITKYALEQHIGAIILATVFLFIEFILRRYKKIKKTEFEKKKAELKSLDEVEDESIEYFKDLQNIDIIRFIFIIIGLVSVLGMYNVKAFNLIAVATGALIIVLRETFLSLFAYFYILSTYKLGEDVKAQNVLGELIRVKPLYVSLAGKDESGEHNGKVYLIPNFTFLTQLVERVKLKSDDYQKMVLKVLYTHDAFGITFDEWKKSIETYLNELLPKRAMTKVGHFRSFTGVRYKFNFDFNDKGEVVVTISFVARLEKSLQFKESIIMYVESLRKKSLEAKEE